MSDKAARGMEQEGQRVENIPLAASKRFFSEKDIAACYRCYVLWKRESCAP